MPLPAGKTPRQRSSERPDGLQNRPVRPFLEVGRPVAPPAEQGRGAETCPRSVRAPEDLLVAEGAPRRACGPAAPVRQSEDPGAGAAPWFNLAAATQGGEAAAENRDALAQLMTREQLAEAQRRAREWFEGRR